jgi:CheY-like chemotaxis protein
MDDEESMREMASNILEKLGCKVTITKNGEEAVKLFTLARKIKKPFDAVVLDLTVVGGMGGKETAEKLLAIDPAIRLIVSSGYSDDPVMARPEAYGFVACVPKPYKKEEMAEVVGRVLEMGSRRDDGVTG